MKLRTVVATLRTARKLIADKRGWTQGCFAKDRAGKCVAPEEPTAVRFCALGSLYHVNGPLMDQSIERLQASARTLYNSDVVSINDGGAGSHPAVLKCF